METDIPTTAKIQNKPTTNKKQDITSLTVFCFGVMAGVMLNNSGFLSVSSGILIGIVLTQYADVSYDSMIQAVHHNKEMFLCYKEKHITNTSKKN